MSDATNPGTTPETAPKTDAKASGGKVTKTPGAVVPPKSKPIRIMNTTADVGDCPACKTKITGDAVVEVHMVAHEGDALGVNVETTTRVRSFRVAHACTPSA